MTGPVATFRAVLPTALGLVLAGCVCGCERAMVNAPAALAPPITPSPNAELADRWYHNWETQDDVLAGSDVDDMFFILGLRGRDWRQPEGPDGYPVRVCLLNRVGQYVHAEGALYAFLVQAPADPYAHRALCAWSVLPEEAERHFRQDKTPGYLLRLDWGPTPPQADGGLMLVIRWVSRDGKYRVTRHLAFMDGTSHVIQTTTRPQAP